MTRHRRTTDDSLAGAEVDVLHAEFGRDLMLAMLARERPEKVTPDIGPTRTREAREKRPQRPVRARSSYWSRRDIHGEPS